MKRRTRPVRVVKTVAREGLWRWVGHAVGEVLRRHEPLVVAVTGSVGKTSAKAAIAALLSRRYAAFAPEPNCGSRLLLGMAGIAVPPAWYGSPHAWRAVRSALTRARADYAYDAVVVEIAAAGPGGLDLPLRHVRPAIGVVTAVAPAHLVGFRTVENVLAEKWKLALASSAVAYNGDDERLRERAARLEASRATAYGLTGGDVRLTELRRLGDLLAGELVIGAVSRPIETRMVARQSLYSLLAAAAVGARLEFRIDEIAEVLAAIEPQRGRMNPIRGRDGSLVLDDSYNASPASVLAALETLSEFAPRRRVAVLGTMKDLGPSYREAHRLVGARVADTADVLVTIGEEARRFLAPAAAEHGMDASSIASFESPHAAGEHVARMLDRDDVVLVKGSQRGVFSEEAIKPLLPEPEAAAALLVRQDGEWIEAKRRAFAQAAR